MAFGDIEAQDGRGMRWSPVHEETKFKPSPSMLDRFWSMYLRTIRLVFHETCLGT